MASKEFFDFVSENKSVYCCFLKQKDTQIRMGALLLICPCNVSRTGRF